MNKDARFVRLRYIKIIFEFSFVESNIIILTKIEKSSPIDIITTAYLLVIW
jgi:hypothetical protein